MINSNFLYPGLALINKGEKRHYPVTDALQNHTIILQDWTLEKSALSSFTFQSF